MSTKNEVKSNKINEEIRSELSLALNNWQNIEISPVKDTPQPVKPQRKTKLLKAIQEQLESLSL